jgi:hypothetical protein
VLVDVIGTTGLEPLAPRSILEDIAMVQPLHLVVLFFDCLLDPILILILVQIVIVGVFVVVAIAVATDPPVGDITPGIPKYPFI